MTERELKKLSRAELLEILLALREQADMLEEEVQSLKKEIEDTHKANSRALELLRLTAAGVEKLCGGSLPNASDEVSK